MKNRKKFVLAFVLNTAVSVAMAEEAPAPTLYDPANNSTVLRTNPYFSWLARSYKGTSATNNRIVISENDLFSGFDEKLNSCNNTCRTAATGVNMSYSNNELQSFLQANRTYYWKVRSNYGDAIADNGNKGVTSQWTSYRSFNTNAPSKPTLYTPNEFENLTGAKFSWSNTNGTNYRIVISQDSSFSGFQDIPNARVCDSSCDTYTTGSATSYEYRKTLMPNTTYYWRVRASSDNGNSEWESSFFKTSEMQVAPTISGNGSSEIEVEKTYSLALVATDKNNDVTKIQVNWGDGESSTFAASNNESKTFSHVYKKDGSYTITGLAFDTREHESTAFKTTVKVNAASPTVEDTSSAAVKTPKDSTITVTKTTDSAVVKKSSPNCSTNSLCRVSELAIYGLQNSDNKNSVVFPNEITDSEVTDFEVDSNIQQLQFDKNKFESLKFKQLGNQLAIYSTTGKLVVKIALPDDDTGTELKFVDKTVFAKYNIAEGSVLKITVDNVEVDNTK